MPSPTNLEGVVVIRSPEVDAKTFTSEVITDTESQYFFVPGSYMIEIVEAVGVTVPAVVSMGYNDPDYNNLVSAVTVGALNDLFAQSLKVPKNSEIKVKKITNSVATTHKFRVIMTGAIFE
jgi:hypothetical protein